MRSSKALALPHRLPLIGESNHFNNLLKEGIASYSTIPNNAAFPEISLLPAARR